MGAPIHVSDIPRAVRWPATLCGGASSARRLSHTARPALPARGRVPMTVHAATAPATKRQGLPPRHLRLSRGGGPHGRTRRVRRSWPATTDAARHPVRYRRSRLPSIAARHVTGPPRRPPASINRRRGTRRAPAPCTWRMPARQWGGGAARAPAPPSLSAPPLQSKSSWKVDLQEKKAV